MKVPILATSSVFQSLLTHSGEYMFVSHLGKCSDDEWKRCVYFYMMELELEGLSEESIIQCYTLPCHRLLFGSTWNYFACKLHTFSYYAEMCCSECGLGE